MEHIGQITGASAAPVGPPLKLLLDLPSTTDLRALVEALETVLSSLSATDARRSGLSHQLKTARTRLRWGEMRDGIQSTRPDDCWCLGAGGRTRVVVAVDPVEYGFESYCDCADGQAAQERATAGRKAAQNIWQQKVVNVFFRDAKVPPKYDDCTWESYPVCKQTQKSFDAIRRWAAGEPIKGETRKEGLFVWGPTGTGKTSLILCALRDILAREPKASLFVVVPEMLDRIKAGFNRDAGTSQDVIVRTVEEVPILVLDDIGTENPTGWVQETVFMIVNHRHNWRLPTLVTSNLPRSQLAARVGDRIAWRLVEMCDTLELNGPNLRDR